MHARQLQQQASKAFLKYYNECLRHIRAAACRRFLNQAVLGAQVLLLTGGVQMIAAEIIMAVLLGVYFTGQSGDKVPYDVGIGILVVVCVFVSGFAYSWGPLAWLVRCTLPVCPASSPFCLHESTQVSSLPPSPLLHARRTGMRACTGHASLCM